MRVTVKVMEANSWTGPCLRLTLESFTFLVTHIIYELTSDSCHKSQTARHLLSQYAAALLSLVGEPLPCSDSDLSEPSLLLVLVVDPPPSLGTLRHFVLTESESEPQVPSLTESDSGPS